ncbi:hypothetical protein MFIFM68171_09548 [Madurella fahalii]|uniref:C2H2-type domain-containing protein n=1 Tax=Madurella fahalii TaxID=1157608 RepID=A0ABQ0GNK9_9PEZI
MRPDQIAYLERVKQEAPNRCEICDHLLPTFEDRERHVTETKHCACPECERYIQPGFVYSHWEVLHDDIHWNDHQINAGDKDTLLAALPWVREEFRKRFPHRDVNAWLGLSEQEAAGKAKKDGETIGETKASL